MNPEQQMSIASNNIKKCLRSKTGGIGNEKAYEDAYKELVRTGLRQKLKGKYSNPVHRV